MIYPIIEDQKINPLTRLILKVGLHARFFMRFGRDDFLCSRSRGNESWQLFNPLHDQLRRLLRQILIVYTGDFGDDLVTGRCVSESSQPNRMKICACKYTFKLSSHRHQLNYVRVFIENLLMLIGRSWQRKSWKVQMLRRNSHGTLQRLEGMRS